MLNGIIEEARTLPRIPVEAATGYDSNKELMIEQVNRELAALPAIHMLIGHNPLPMMREHHRNHARFMLTVFSLNQYELLARTVPWVYRTYHAHGFSYDYFRVQLEAWERAISRHLDGPAAQAVLGVYDWVLSRHRGMIELAERGGETLGAIGSTLDETGQSFLAALLIGDHRECLRLAERSVKTPQELESFYLDIAQPCMFELGRLWELGEISAVEENLATAVMSRVMATIYPRLKVETTGRGKAVVTTAPNEYHALGAWIVSDLLGLDGWDVDFLGANPSETDILDALLSAKPDLLAISVAMPFNLHPAMRIVAAVRNEPALEGTKTMIGGHFIRTIPDLWPLTGADGCAYDAKSAIALARKWGRQCTE
jgi:MerR family transcriptional regulator, light-induced transcriptional regulator